MTVSILYPSQCYLGESPVWLASRRSYCWVDIEEGMLYELSRERNRCQAWRLDTKVSLILEDQQDGLLLAVQGGIVQFRFEDESLHWLVRIDEADRENRCNDGGCDPDGRIWVGTMDLHAKAEAGSLYRIDTGGEVTPMLNRQTIPNGMVWSKDGRTLYYIETLSGTVKSWSYDKVTGKISREKVVIRIAPVIGMPDGMTIDEEGMLWIALYSGFAVTRWNPQTGKLLKTIELPVPHVTNCCFVGENLDQLMVTTAREHLSEEELEKYPDSGSVFIVEGLGVKGIPAHKAAVRPT